LRGESEDLTGLFGELLGMILLPYLGAAAARREQHGSKIFASEREGPVEVKGAVRSSADFSKGDLLAGVPMRMTYRTALVLEAISSRPGVSNRVVADLAGISDQGQVSKLLARLERLGLIDNNGGEEHSKGEPNAWVLTEMGQRVAQGIR